MTTTDTLGKAVCSTGEMFFIFGNGTTDGTEGEIYVRNVSGTLLSIGDALRGKVLVRLALQASTGSVLNAVKLYGPSGEVLLSAIGCERTSNQTYNIDIQNLAIGVFDGAKLKVTTAD